MYLQVLRSLKLYNMSTSRGASELETVEGGVPRGASQLEAVQQRKREKHEPAGLAAG